MPAGERTFVMKFLGDTRGVSGSFDKINGELKGLDSSLTGTQKVAAGIGASSLIQNLGAGFTGKLLGSANAASNLTEAMNKSRVVFGDYDSLVQAFGKTSANTFGISKRAAHEYAGTLGQILSAGGMNQQQSAGMSVELLKLASDMASFNNISIDDALEKIRAGLVGETEPLRTVGVLLSEAAVRQKAMEMGIYDGTGALTEQQKVQARYALILDQTKSAQGDFARTSDEAANASRRVAAEGENAAATVGGPTNEAFKLLRNAWLDIPAVGRELISTVGLIAGGLAVFAAILPSMIGGFGLIAGSAAALGPILVAAFPFLLIAAAVAAIIAIGVLLYKNWDTIKEKATQLKDWVVGIFTSLGEALKGPLSVLAGLLMSPFLPVKEVIDGIVAAKNLLTGGGDKPHFELGKLNMAQFGGGGDVEGYASGGVVPGPIGSARLAMVHGGEEILTPRQRGGVVINLTVHGSVHDEASLANAVRNALNADLRRGSLGFA